MKKILYTLLFMTFLALLLNLFSVSAQEVIGPQIVFEETIFDAEDVKEGEIIEHTFKVLNKGDSPLEIKKVKPD